jgi:DNA-binding GntR family transcriptional regulator
MGTEMRKRRTAVDSYGVIKDMILTGQLKPGNRLSDQDLAVVLGVSRTPVRHALSRLAQDGLLEEGRGKGYRVADLDAKQVADLYALREVLEAHAIRLAVERATSSDLQEFKEVLATLEKLSEDPSKRGEEIRVGLKIHEIIARASGDAFLHETLVRLLNRMHFFIWMDTLNEDPQAAELTRHEHSDLLELIRSEKPDEAEALIRVHIRTAKQAILKILAARDAFYQPATAGIAGGDSDARPVSTNHGR